MVSIISTDNRNYHSFFTDVIETMDGNYKGVSKILVVGIPDGSSDDIHLSIMGMSTSDMFQVAGILQHEATRELIAEEIDYFMNDEDEYEDDEDEDDLSE